MSDRRLVLTVHGLNSDGEWQRRAEAILGVHGSCVPYQYRDYRYSGFALQFFDPLPAMGALGFLGASISIQKAAAVSASLPSWLPHSVTVHSSPAAFLAALTAAQIILAMVVIGMTISAAMQPVTAAPSIRGFFVILFTSFVLVASGAMVAGSDRFQWMALVSAATLCLTIGLLEALRTFPFVNLTKTWLIPAGIATLAFAAGTALGRGSIHVLELTSLPMRDEAAAGFLVLSMMAGVLSIHGARHRRKRSVEKLKKWLEERCKEHEVEHNSQTFPIHLFAHSFGTYLVGEVLKVWEGRPFRSAILVGSAMRPDYGWDQLFSKGIVHHVRNEIGGRDGVIRFAGVSLDAAPFAWLPGNSSIKSWRPFGSLGLGAAGHTGFRDAGTGTIHDVRNSLEFCEQCRTREEREKPRVHNVWLPTFRHSDGIDASERIGRFWLPLMLDFEPWEYWDFRRLCSQKEAYAETLQARRHDVEQSKQRGRQLGIELAKHADDVRLESDIRSKLQEHEAAEHALLDLVEEAANREAAVLAQLERRAWDWTFVRGQRETLLYFVADKLEDEWFRDLDPLPAGDAARAYKWLAARRAPALVTTLVTISLEAHAALRNLEKTPVVEGQPDAPPAAHLLRNLDPRIACLAVVATSPRPGSEELSMAEAGLLQRAGAVDQGKPNV